MTAKGAARCVVYFALFVPAVIAATVVGVVLVIYELLQQPFTGRPPAWRRTTRNEPDLRRRP